MINNVNPIAINVAFDLFNALFKKFLMSKFIRALLQRIRFQDNLGFKTYAKIDAKEIRPKSP